MYIRPVKDADFPGLIWEGLEEWEEAISKDFSVKEAKQLIWLVAEENNEPIGQIVATMKGKSGTPYVFALRVRSDYQQKGIGTQLIKEAEKELVQRGAKDVTIAVDKGNRAIRLYQRLGYSQLGEEKQEHWTRTYKGKVIEEDITLIYLEKKL